MGRKVSHQEAYHVALRIYRGVHYGYGYTAEDYEKFVHYFYGILFRRRKDFKLLYRKNRYKISRGQLARLWKVNGICVSAALKLLEHFRLIKVHARGRNSVVFTFPLGVKPLITAVKNRNYEPVILSGAPQ